MPARLLIVDDSDLVRRSLRAVLQRNPEWQVFEAADGFGALKVFKELEPHVVVMDFQMPGLDGIETARRMIEIAPSMPIVMFTQHASAQLERHALGVGIRSVVAKTDTSLIVRAIERLLAPDGPEPPRQENSRM